MAAPPETGLSVVTDALLISGVTGQGMPPSAADTSFAFRRLNGLVSLWNTKRWMIFHLLNMGVTANGRTTPYLIGPGASDINVARRPDRIEYSFVRQNFSGGLPVDTPLTVCQSREEYDANTLKKSFVSYPSMVFLDTKWGIGEISIYPWPTAALYQIFFTFKDVLPVFTPTTLMSSIPDQYLECMKLNLARRLRQSYGKRQPDPELNAQAKDALNTVKNSNIQVPQLVMPVGVRQGAGIYNIYSDSQS